MDDTIDSDHHQMKNRSSAESPPVAPLSADRLAAFEAESMTNTAALQTSLSQVNADQISFAESFAQAIKATLQRGTPDLLDLEEVRSAVDQFLRLSKQIEHYVILDQKLSRQRGELLAARQCQVSSKAKNRKSDTHSAAQGG